MPDIVLSQAELKNICKKINDLKEQIADISDELCFDPTIPTTALEHLKSKHQDSAHSHLNLVWNIVARKVKKWDDE